MLPERRWLIPLSLYDMSERRVERIRRHFDPLCDSVYQGARLKIKHGRLHSAMLRWFLNRTEPPEALINVAHPFDYSYRSTSTGLLRAALMD